MIEQIQTDTKREYLESPHFSRRPKEPFLELNMSPDKLREKLDTLCEDPIKKTCILAGGEVFADAFLQYNSEKKIESFASNTTEIGEYKTKILDGYKNISDAVTDSSKLFSRSIEKIVTTINKHKDNHGEILNDEFFLLINKKKSEVIHLLELSSTVIDFKYTEIFNFSQDDSFLTMNSESLQKLIKVEEKGIERINNKLNKIILYIQNISNLSNVLEIDLANNILTKDVEEKKKNILNILDPSREVSSKEEATSLFENIEYREEGKWKEDLEYIIRHKNDFKKYPSLLTLMQVNDYVDILSKTDSTDEINANEIKTIKDILIASMLIHADFAIKNGYQQTFIEITNNLDRVGAKELSQKLLKESHFST